MFKNLRMCTFVWTLQMHLCRFCQQQQTLMELPWWKTSLGLIFVAKLAKIISKPGSIFHNNRKWRYYDSRAFCVTQGEQKLDYGLSTEIIRLLCCWVSTVIVVWGNGWLPFCEGIHVVFACVCSRYTTKHNTLWCAYRTKVHYAVNWFNYNTMAFVHISQ